jgi:excisionase family DNA binding protein
VLAVTSHLPEGDPTDDLVARLPEVLTRDQAAWLLRLTPGRLDAAAKRGEIPARRVGRRMLYSKTALLRFVAGNG